MCLFPSPNLNFNGLAYLKGIREFDCGACPECLRKRSNIWALRAVYESKLHSHNCMITLTYDNFKSSDGSSREEFPPDPSLHVCKRHIQLFIKRLRKWYSKISDEKIKYIACAEYGSRTHRAHYHLLLFGIDFPDKHYYKKSKRNNIIYMSKTLTDLWGFGICTIDSINVHSGVARYCTKYCAKSRSDDTFMLCSQKIGFEALKRDFNGLSYFIEGREFPVPRFIWEDYIVNKYQRKFLYLKNAPLLSPKYVNAVYDEGRNFILNEFDYERSKAQRAFYRKVRDNDPLYINYLSYWQRKGLQFEQNLLPVMKRIYLLDGVKFHNYKIAALKCKSERNLFIPNIAPGSNCVSDYYRELEKRRKYYGEFTCPSPSRPNRASDTKKPYFIIHKRFKVSPCCRVLPQIDDSPPVFVQSAQQILLDF